MNDKLYQTEEKKPWQSKTLWSNLIISILAFLPTPVKEFLTPETLSTVFLIVNTILRLVTKSKISIT